MKSVLISIRPKWCELIASGRKTIECRKSLPQGLCTCYIYCTKGTFDITACPNLNADSVKKVSDGRGKVIGEFKICAFWEFKPDDYGGSGWGFLNIGNYTVPKDLFDKMCMSADEFIKYADNKTVFGWEISKVKIYDKPKELSEFRHCTNKELPCAICKSSGNYFDCGEKVKRPPQSYFYVENIK